jgi:2-(1,2-epoxy-1,2-dihydrophenyl)acetyl-CoA isomerase
MRAYALTIDMSATTEVPRPSSELPIDEQVRHHVTDDGVAWITLDRPDVKNAISPDQRDRVIELLDEASRLLAIRAVVLTATGDAFCTGADLRARHRQDPRPEGAPDRPVGHVSRMVATGAQRLVTSVMDCEKPVIAAVNGTAAGIGAHLAFAADLVVAAESARFIEVFVRRGLVPDGAGAYLLPRIVGLHRAKELLFLGDAISADQALELGLVNRVVPAEQVVATAGEIAARLAQGPTRALALSKWLCNRSLDVDRTTALNDEAWAQEMNMTTRDANEGVQSFIERREPDYLGW